MAKDVLGNRLEKGDIVQMRLDHPSAMGQVAEIKETSLLGVRRNGSELQPGTITILATFVLPIDPTNPVLPSLAKLHRDNAPAALPSADEEGPRPLPQ